MLTEDEITKARDFLDSAKRPIILFDDDTDGLSSFLLVYKYLSKNTDEIMYLPVKENPELQSELFIRKIKEFKPDTIIILDKPLVQQQFLDDASSVTSRIMWLDHHPIVDRKNVFHLNPLRTPTNEFPKDNRPTTYWAHKITDDENNLWIAAVGCVGDWFTPDFLPEVAKKYPNLLDKNKYYSDPGEVLHETVLGKLCRIIQFNMKSGTTNISLAIDYMTKIKDPAEILDSTSEYGKYIYKQYAVINRVYEKILSEISEQPGKLLYYLYNEKYAVTGDLANELQHKYPEKVILIARAKEDEIVCSIRSNKIVIRDILEKALVGIRGHGGGHAHACGAGILRDDFQQFLDNIRAQL